MSSSGTESSTIQEAPVSKPKPPPPKKVKSFTSAGIKNFNKLVTLYVGDSDEKHVVHSDFACHYSPTFKAAFNSQLIEGQTQEYRLQDTTSAAVGLLVDWLYTQKPVYPDPSMDWSRNRMMVDLWILAAKLLIPSLQNIVIQELEAERRRTQIVWTGKTNILSHV